MAETNPFGIPDAGASIAKQVVERIVLREAVEGLTETQQQVVNCRVFRGMSAKQTAEDLGISEGNVRVIQYRSMAVLREVLAEDFKD